MKKYRMPFEYWEDDHTKLLRKTKAPEFLDPEYYLKAHFHLDKNGKGPYFLNKAGRKLLDVHGPFCGNYHDGEELCNSYSEDIYIVCPGPSLKDFNLKKLKNKFTIAVNSAGFLFKPTYWLMAESGYAKWLIEKKSCPIGVNIISTARVAVFLRKKEIESRKKKWDVWVIRWEEEKVVPIRTPAVSISNALVTAWQMGSKRVFVLGLDLSRPGNQPYISGVPYTREGAENPFDDQIRALKQFQLPDFEIVNCSPYSKDILPFRYCSYDGI